MKYKRLVCAVFALMLVGTSVASTATVFADEPAEIEGAGEVVNTEEPEVAASEVKEEEVPETPANGEEVEKEEIAEPAGTAKAALRAAPVLAASNEVLRDGEGGGEPTESYALSKYVKKGSSFNMSVEGIDWNSWRTTYRCTYTTVSGVENGATCGQTTRDYYVYTLNVPTGEVVANELGEYVIKIEQWQGWNWAEVASVRVVVYGLEAESDCPAVVNINEEINCNPGSVVTTGTYGEIKKTVKFVAAAGGEEEMVTDVDFTKEGMYTVAFTNVDAAAHGVELPVQSFVLFTAKEETLPYGLSENTIMVKKGEKLKIEVDSDWAIDKMNDMPVGGLHIDDSELSEGEETVAPEAALTYKGNGVVVYDTANVPLGMHTLWLGHCFGEDGVVCPDPMADEQYDAVVFGIPEVLKGVSVMVYEMNADEKDLNEASTATLEGFVRDCLNDMGDDGEAWDEFEKRLIAAFGEEYAEAAFGRLMGASVFGHEINTLVEVNEITDLAEVKGNLVAKMLSLDADNVQYYDVQVFMDAGGDMLYPMHELSKAMLVAIAGVTDPATGYTRKYIVVREHNGNLTELEEGIDFFILDGKLYVLSDKFSTFAVAYKDTLIPVTYALKAPETGEATETEGGASASLSMTVVTVIAAVTLAGAVVFAKRK